MIDIIMKPLAYFSKKIFTLAVLSAFVTGCSSLDPLEVRPVEDNIKSPTTLYGSTAAVRNVTVRDRKNSRIICAEPMPDAAFDQEEEADWDLSFISFGGDEKGEEESASVEAGLGGRSPNVLITREILFRYCEFISNVEFTSKEKAEMFKDVLDSLVKINQVSLGKGTRAEAGTTLDIEESHTALPSGKRPPGNKETPSGDDLDDPSVDPTDLSGEE